MKKDNDFYQSIYSLMKKKLDYRMDEGVEHFHFYTLNRPFLTRDVCIALGVKPDPKLALVA